MTEPDHTADMEHQLRQLTDLGAIDYYLPSNPAGQRFVVGVNSQIVNMDPEQAMCFIAGAHSVARVMAGRLLADPWAQTHRGGAS